MTVPTVHVHYDILFDSDEDYKKGKKIANSLVYGTYKESNEILNTLLKNKIGNGLWHTKDCTITFDGSKDRETPGNPLCFGKITITGREDKAAEIEQILLQGFPNIDISKTKHTVLPE